MAGEVIIRAPAPDDYAAWRPLWDGYNAFYGRSGETALPEHITSLLWARLFDPASRCTPWSPSVTGG
jgi:hypothetical protein